MKQVEQTTPARQDPRVAGVWVLAERFAWTFSLAALTVWGAATLAAIAGARQDLATFEARRLIFTAGRVSITDENTGSEPVGFGARPRLARRLDATGSCAARHPPHSQDPSRGGRVAWHG